MLNYWWVTRPKRKLNSIPEVLSTFAEASLDQEWQGQRDSHLSFEEMLEEAGLKRKGERRDQTGGGARTYKAWVIQNTHASLNPFCWSSYRVQHILDKNAIPGIRGIHQHMGDRTH